MTGIKDKKIRETKEFEIDIPINGDGINGLIQAAAEKFRENAPWGRKVVWLMRLTECVRTGNVLKLRYEGELWTRKDWEEANARSYVPRKKMKTSKA